VPNGLTPLMVLFAVAWLDLNAQMEHFVLTKRGIHVLPTALVLIARVCASFLRRRRAK